MRITVLWTTVALTVLLTLSTLFVSFNVAAGGAHSPRLQDFVGHIVNVVLTNSTTYMGAKLLDIELANRRHAGIIILYRGQKIFIPNRVILTVGLIR